MPAGASGRVVVEIDVELKRRLYSVLARRGMTMKAWLTAAASDYIRGVEQPNLGILSGGMSVRARNEEAR